MAVARSCQIIDRVEAWRKDPEAAVGIGQVGSIVLAGQAIDREAEAAVGIGQVESPPCLQIDLESEAAVGIGQVGSIAQAE